MQSSMLAFAGAHDEQPEWHRCFVMEKLDPLTISMLRELSATRSASKAETSDVDQLYQALRLGSSLLRGIPHGRKCMLEAGNHPRSGKGHC
jgi:hypothetical protein